MTRYASAVDEGNTSISVGVPRVKIETKWLILKLLPIFFPSFEAVVELGVDGEEAENFYIHYVRYRFWQLNV